MLVWLLHNTVLAAMLAAVVVVACRLLRCRPAVRHALWLIVLVRLLLPPGLHWPWSLPTLWEQSPAAQAAVPEPASLVPATENIAPMADGSGIEVTRTFVEEQPLVEVPKEQFAWLPWVSRGLLSVWLLGAAAFFCRHVARLMSLRRWVRLGRPAPGSLGRVVDQLAAKFGIRAPRVLSVAGLSTPLVGSLPRTVLLWPAGLEDRLAPEGVRAVLAHELAHLRRRDHWVRWLEIAAECVWWWNPLFSLIRRKLRENAELACDAWVVTLLPAARRAYAEALLTVCETGGRPAEPAPALGIGGDDRRDFQRRLMAIMREPASGRVSRRVFVALAALALLVIPGWSLSTATVAETHDQAARVDDQLRLSDALWSELNVAVDEIRLEGDSSDRDQKLNELEARIRAMLKELQLLREQRLAATPPASAPLIPTIARRLTTSRPGVRTSHPVAPEKAESVAKFLLENLQPHVREASASGGTLEVVTTPEAAEAVARLVQLIDTPARGVTSWKQTVKP